MSGQVLFQALPPLAPDEYRALEESILEHGVMVPIILDENGVVIDGHHRQKITVHHGLPCPSETKSGYTDSEKRTLALSLNIDRRQLSREQKRALIAESLKADPQLSNREHAKRTGVSDKTVGTVRDELEESAEIPHFTERIDPRTGNASQPASKGKPVTDPVDDRFISSDDLDELNAPPPRPKPQPTKRSSDEERAHSEADIINAVAACLTAERINAYTPKAKRHLTKILTSALNQLEGE